MSKYRKSWTTAMQEVQESAALQLKMAFDDAGIKIKGTKGGKLVIAKKDEKKVEKIIAKQMKKPSDAKRVLGSQIVFEEVEIDEKTYYNLERGVYEMGKEKHDRKKEVKQGYPNAIEVKSTVKQAAATVAKLNKEEVEIDEKFAGWIAFYNKEKLEIKPKKGEIDSLYDAKQAAIKHFKVPKSKQGLLAIEPAHEEVELAEKGTAYPATVDTLKQIVKDKQHQTVMFDKGSAKVDLFTASAMLTVYKALKQPHLKKKFEDMIKSKEGFMQTQAFAMKVTK